MMLKRFVCAVVILSHVALPCYAQSKNGLTLMKRDEQTIIPASEYVFRNDVDETLIPVYLLGAVNKPGLYHVPIKTDIVSLIALSGGVSAGAKVSDITVRNKAGGEAKEIDLEEFLHSKDQKPLALSQNDVVYIESRKPVVSNDTVLVVGLVSGLMGIIVSGFLVSQQLNKK